MLRAGSDCEPVADCEPVPDCQPGSVAHRATGYGGPGRGR